MSSGAVFSPTTPSMVGIPSLVGTPSDTASSLSSFTSTGQQMLSPESIESMAMSPDDSCRTGIVGKTSTFKAHNRKSMDIEKLASSMHTNSSNNNNNNNNCSNSTGNLDNGNIRSVRPTPPSTLNLGPLRIPPAPPPRWNKSTTPNTSPNDLTPVDGQSNNFTVTTTVTFSVDGNNVNSQLMEMISPNANQAVNVNGRWVGLRTILYSFHSLSFSHPVSNDFKAIVARRWMQNISRYDVIARIEALAKSIQQRFQSAQNRFAGFVRSTKWTIEAESRPQRIEALPSNSEHNEIWIELFFDK